MAVPVTTDSTTGIEVWVEARDDLDALTHQLDVALGDTGARIAGVETTSGSLWPVPVDATTNRVRVRLEVAGDEGAVADALEHIASVTPWSLVHRTDGGAAKASPVLH